MMPVLGGVTGPWSVAKQCMCSGVYLRNRWRSLWSWMEYSGRLWKRRQPTEKMSGSLDLRIRGAHRCFFSRMRLWGARNAREEEGVGGD